MAELQLQPSIAGDRRSQAMLALINRLGAPTYLDQQTPRLVTGRTAATAQVIDDSKPGRIDPTTIINARIDSVPASVLPYLLWQWDMLSPYWSLLAPIGSSTEDAATAARRSAIAAAISLHRRRGTASAVREALAAAGWPNAQLLEGQDSWGGTRWPPEQGWAVCRLILDLQAIVITNPGGTVPVWSPFVSYPAGFAVWFPAVNAQAFVAVTDPQVGIQPYYATVAEVPDIGLIANMESLRTIFWTPPIPMINGVAYRSLTPEIVALLTAAFYFYAPLRCQLDIIEGRLPTVLADTLPPLTDDVELSPADRLSLRDLIVLPGRTEVLDSRAPRHNRLMRRHGSIDYSKNPVGLIDAGIGKLN